MDVAPAAADSAASSRPQWLVGTSSGLRGLPGGDVRLANHEVIHLAAGADGCWAVVDGREIWRGALTGGWVKVVGSDTLRLHCLLPTADGIVAGTSEARLLRLAGHGLEPIPGFDETPGRADWHTPWGGPPDVRSLAAAADGTVYANVHVGGIARSTDGGATWSPTIDVDSDVHQVLADHGSGWLLAASARGLAASRDGGRSWQWRSDGLHATYLRAIAVAGDTLVVSASEGPRGRRSALYRAPLAGGPFQRCRDGLPESFDGNIDTFCLAATGARVAAGTAAGELFVSADAGASWQRDTDGLAPVRCVLGLA